MREDGDDTTVISESLIGTGNEGMRTDDWMFFYADIFLESVQYGNRTRICDTLQGMEDAT